MKTLVWLNLFFLASLTATPQTTSMHFGKPDGLQSQLTKRAHLTDSAQMEKFSVKIMEAKHRNKILHDNAIAVLKQQLQQNDGSGEYLLISSVMIISFAAMFFIKRSTCKEQTDSEVKLQIAKKKKKIVTEYKASLLKIAPARVQEQSLDEKFITQVREVVEGNISNTNFGVVQMAEQVNLSRASYSVNSRLLPTFRHRSSSTTFGYNALRSV